MAPSCSFVEFELSPYAPRGLDVVYSHQEDVTFFVWRMGDVVDFDRVDFELFRNGAYEPIDLNDAPFPHAPFECDRIYQCVQFQVPGQWSGSGENAPIRAIDKRHGVFESTSPRYQEVQTTIDIDPVGVNNNVSAMPRRYDWFAEEEVPIRRSFEWTLIAADGVGSNCPTDAADGWSELRERVRLPQNWISTTPCFVARPDRRDAPGTEVRRPLINGAMLHAEDVRIPIPETKHPTLIAFLVDLEIVNEQRCRDAVSAIRDQVFETLDELSEPDERDAPYYNIGTFRPIEPDGTEHSGCDQTSGGRYPIDDILVIADEEASTLDENATLLIVYLNNLDLPPADAKFDDIEPLFDEQEPDANPHRFTWAIGSNTTAFLFPWDDVTPWAPIEDENFLPSIESKIKVNFPLRSTDFSGEDSVPLYQPNAAESPQYFRICTFSPDPTDVELPPEAPMPYSSDTWDWSEEDEPELHFDIPPQEYELYQAFQETHVTGVYEVCDEYCENPFLSNNETIYESWLDAHGVCRWR